MNHHASNSPLAQNPSKFNVVVKWIAVCIIGVTFCMTLLVGLVLWKFTPLITINDSGIELLNGAISIKSDCRDQTNSITT